MDDEPSQYACPPTSNNILLARSNLSQYGIREETVLEFEISCGGTVGRNGRVIIPLHDPDGSRIGHAVLSDWGDPVIVPATRRADQLLYNCHRAIASGSRQVIVVQDFFDCLRVFQCGFPAVVALLGPGMSATQEMELVARFRAVVLMFRGDDAGWALTQDCIHRLVTQLSVHAAVLPSNQTPRGLNDEDLLAALRYSAITD